MTSAWHTCGSMTFGSAVPSADMNFWIAHADLHSIVVDLQDHWTCKDSNEALQFAILVSI